MGGQLFLLDWKTGRRAALLKEGRPITNCEFKPDGQLLFCIAGQRDMGEEDACYSVGKDIYGTWRNGSVRLDKLKPTTEIKCRVAKTHHSQHEREHAVEESDDMTVIYCFVEEDITRAPSQKGRGTESAKEDLRSERLFTLYEDATLIQDGVVRQTKWERKLRRIAEEKGKCFDSSKTVWGVDFHDENTLIVTKVAFPALCVFRIDDGSTNGTKTDASRLFSVIVGQLAGSMEQKGRRQAWMVQEDAHLQPLRQRPSDPIP